MLAVRVTDRQRIARVSPGRWTRLLRLASPKRWAHSEISLVIVSKPEMTRLNRRHTGRKGDTDVLAFDLAGGEDRVVGEIIVNASRAKEQARLRKADACHELALYVVHGALHLQGYDDHSPADRRRMYRREEATLKRAGVPYTRYATAKSPKD